MLIDAMETRASSTSRFQDMTVHTQQVRPSCRAARRAMAAQRCSALRAERYREAEARLAQSLRHCQEEPSLHELQVKALERATRILSQFAESSGHQAKQLSTITANRAAIADLDPESYRSTLSQRWRAERQRDLISLHMKILQQAITSLAASPTSANVPSGAGIALSQGGHEGNQAPGSEDKTYANLVSFLCCPQRVAPLHHRSRSRFPKVYHRPLQLNIPSVVPPTVTPSLTTRMKSIATQTISSGDSSLDMHIQTPVITDSLAEQQAQLRLSIYDDSEAGTAIILTRPLPSPIPPDPSNVEIELPAYVHELLADFDAQDSPLPSAATAVKFQADTPNNDPRSGGGLWPFRMRRKDRLPGKAMSHPNLRSKSSLKRLSGFLSTSDTLALLRKDNVRDDGSGTTLTSVSETRSGGDIGSPTHSRASSSTKGIGKIASRIGHRISFVNSKYGA
ncbi:hypothetical protein P691DRAFT_729446 [Macrolepiota fuliginosa MF-IS2]|uniref:Uncharacterized protein n=1 Tax=Macrolepiota fuliginosa MF-IS2 TaxID=1400762 RepID=A0A9P6C4B0_9AGAR|nr:hypothetical protein P691DRAFT_729446 [Macrolepiota fuliginosa MF-IS2]